MTQTTRGGDASTGSRFGGNFYNDSENEKDLWLHIPNIQLPSLLSQSAIWSTTTSSAIRARQPLRWGSK